MKLILEKKDVTENQLESLIAEISSQIKSPATIYLSGGLGAGKTTFISRFCAHYLIEHTSSPTFAIHNRYESEAAVVDHFDLYRLESEEDLQAAGFYDLMNENADFKIIEWPERIKDELLNSFGSSYWISVKKSADLESARDYYFYLIS